MSVALGILAASAALGAGMHVGGAVAGARGRRKAADAMWTEEDKRRLRALERQEALGMLGADEARSERLMQQSLDPVQAAEREAQAKTAAQFAGAVGAGGQYFRGTTAMQESAQEQRTAATKAAQEQERMAAQQQEAMKRAEMDALRQQRMQSELTRYGQAGQGAMQAGSALSQLGMQAALIGQQMEEAKILADSGADIAEGAEDAAGSMNWFEKQGFWVRTGTEGGF